jgi:2-dehydro-3-deoxy-D-arabinonate dehydratase
VYDGSCAIGPCVLLADSPFSRDTQISIEIDRGGSAVFSGETTLAALKREPQVLAEYLFRENSFPHGAFLLTGTGIVPGDEFTLAAGDVIRIEIAGIGVLTNIVG